MKHDDILWNNIALRCGIGQFVQHQTEPRFVYKILQAFFGAYLVANNFQMRSTGQRLCHVDLNLGITFSNITVKTLCELLVWFAPISNVTIPSMPSSVMSAISFSKFSPLSFQLGSSTGQPPRELRRSKMGCGPNFPISATKERAWM